MKGILIKILKFAGFLSIGLFFFWLAYRDANVNEIVNAMKQANLNWLWFAMSLSLFSHLSRAYRWNILIEPLGYKPRITNTFLSILIMYLTNFAVPRSGEIARCGILTQYEKIPFPQLLGTVFLERLVDMLVVLLFLLLTLVTQYTEIIEFFNENIGSGIVNLITSPALIAGLVAFVVLLLIVVTVFRKRFSHTAFYQKISGTIAHFIIGIKTIKTMKNKWQFIFHTLVMFGLYYFMLYFACKAFDQTAQLTMLQVLAVFTLSNLGMVAPSPGGIGTWHFMVIGTLFIYKVDDLQAKAFAIATHGAVMLFLVVAGFIAMIVLPIYNDARKKQLKTEN